jgi:hypothetical protein
VRGTTDNVYPDTTLEALVVVLQTNAVPSVLYPYPLVLAALKPLYDNCHRLLSLVFGILRAGLGTNPSVNDGCFPNSNAF